MTSKPDDHDSPRAGKTILNATLAFALVVAVLVVVLVTVITLAFA